MIFLIYGATHVGKTKLAQRLLEMYQIPYLSIDHLKMGLIRSGLCPLTVEDDRELTEYLWPIVSEMIKTAIENDQNMIIEGCYIPFDWERSFDAGYRPQIRAVCLVMTDAYIEKNFSEIREHSSDIETRIDDSYVTVERLIAENQRYREGCNEYGCDMVLIDDDYELTLDSWLDRLRQDLGSSNKSYG